MPLAEGGPGMCQAAVHALVSSLDPVFLCSLPGGEVLQASRSAGRLLGVPSEQLIGQPLSCCLSITHDIDWHDGEPPIVRLWLRQSAGTQPVALHASRVPDSGGTLGVAWVRPILAGLFSDVAHLLPLALRLHDHAGQPVLTNHAAQLLPSGPLPDGYLRAGERAWQVARVDLDQLTLNVAAEVTTWDNRARQSNELAASFRLMLDTIEEMVGVVSVDESFLFINPAYYRATGWTEGDLKSTNFRTRIHPDDLDLVERTRAVNLRGERTRIEYRCRCKNGSYLWLDLRATPLPGPDGKVGRIVWAGRDVTERKRLEQELRDSRLFIEQVADAIPQMLFVYDLIERRYTWVNAQCLAVRGYTPGEMLAMGPGETVSHIHPDDRLEMEELMRRLVEARAGVVQMRYRARHPRLGWRRLYTRCLVFRHGDDGQPWQVLGVSEDVTGAVAPVPGDAGS